MSVVSPTETRPRPHSVLSFGSKRSRRSTGSGPKQELIESPKDKKRLNTKADPSMAMNEAQPAAVALEESNLGNIRKVKWKDGDGNDIDEPDRSNPSRRRMERPLDTIRSFEAAVEGTYNSRRSTFSSMPASQINSNAASRRNSYFGVNVSNGNRSSQYGAGYYPYGAGYYPNGRGYGQRSDSVAEGYEGRESRSSHPSRPLSYGSSPVVSLPASLPATENFYSSHSHQPSDDTITTGVGSYGTDTRGDSTDPSSQNSSVDQISIKPEEYSFDNNQGIGYANGPYSPVSPIYSSEQSFWKGANGRPQAPYGWNEYTNEGDSPNQVHSPVVPQREDRPHLPMKLNAGYDAAPRPTPPKRQSWLKRRFSKKAG